MTAGVRVKADVVGAGIGKGGGQRIDRLHHQMHIDRHLAAIGGDGMRLERAADHGAESQVGHVVVVHHVKMNPVGAGGDDVFDFLTQPGEVGRQDGGGDLVSGFGVFGHGWIVA